MKIENRWQAQTLIHEYNELESYLCKVEKVEIIIPGECRHEHITEKIDPCSISPSFNAISVLKSTKRGIKKVLETRMAEIEKELSKL